MKLFEVPEKSNNSALFKIVVDAPGGSTEHSRSASFVREFNSIKALRQFERRNSAIKDAATAYTLHNHRWERFVIYGSNVIPETVLRSLLNSLEKEATKPSTTNQPI